MSEATWGSSERRAVQAAEQTERDVENREPDEDEVHYESSASVAERVRQFATIKDLHTADTLGSLDRARVS